MSKFATKPGELYVYRYEPHCPHTKGPWHLRGSNEVYSSNNKRICETMHEANAALIAAAPELLENFEKAIRLIEHIQEKHGLVYEVTILDGYKLIKKATGGAE